MGGLGSGNRFRWHTKAEVESYRNLRLDVRDKRLKKYLRLGVSLPFRYRYLEQEISIEIFFDWTPCNYGGQRPWFKCPRCWRRVAVLFFIGQSLVCRQCAELTYSSRNEDRWSRAIRRAHKILERLGGEPDSFLPFPPRPKGMHHKTYYHLIKRWDEATQESWEFVERLVAKTRAG